VEGLDLTTESGKEAYITLLNLAEASDKYYDQLDEVVGKLRDARESMQMEGMAYAQMRATSAQLSLTTILDQARQGNFANVGQLDKSLSTLTSSASSTDLFATRADYETNFWRTYNSLAELEGLIGGTIPIDQQTLNVAQDQLSVLQNIDQNIANSTGGDIAITPTSTGSTAKAAGADSAELLKEIKLLREEIQASGRSTAASASKTAVILDRWDLDGLPAERTIT